MDIVTEIVIGESITVLWPFFNFFSSFWGAHAQYNSGWHMGTAKPVTQIEATIHDSVSERRLVPASRTHTACDNIYSDPYAL